MQRSTMIPTLLIALTLVASSAAAGNDCHDRISTGLILNCGGAAEAQPSYGFGLALLPGAAGNFTAAVPNSGLAGLRDTMFRCSCDDKGSAKKPKLNKGAAFICTTEPVLVGGGPIVVLQGTLNKKGTKVSKGRGHVTTHAIVGGATVQSFIFSCNDEPIV